MMRYLSIGQGITAASVQRYCQRRDIALVQIDDPMQITDLADLDFDEIVISPGLPRAHPNIQALLAQSHSVIGDIELFMRDFKGQLIAVTGSNGKSTTVSMIDHALRQLGYDAVLAGNIGVPALDVLDAQNAIAVLELSSFQLESTPSMHSDIAMVLNLSEDHLDRYSGMQDYAATKAHIYSDSGCQICNQDDPLSFPCEGAPVAVPSKDILTAKGLWVDGQWLDTVPGIEGINRLNASFALTALAHMGVDVEAARQSLRSFAQLEHRNAHVATLGAVRYINDSKATNPGATVSAIMGAGAPVYVILGGQTKGADLQPVAEVAADFVAGFVSMGVDAARFESLLPQELFLGRVASMQEAVTQLASAARENSVVLLSPAAASLDMYENYKARGEAFVSAVRAMETQ